MKEIDKKLVYDKIAELGPTASDAEITTLIADICIDTQEGKEWYYKQVASLDMPQFNKLLMELAYYKFPEEK